MSGHNRWSTIKHKKAMADAKKAKGWTKLIKEITVSARSGSDASGNPRLRTAIDKAREANIPNDTIDRAIKKGSGELGAENVEELVYQVYGPGGVAILVELATDNRNRTASELRKLLEKGNAKIDASGSVLRKFKKRGQLIFDGDQTSEDQVTEAALDLGAEDVQVHGETIVVYCEPGSFYQIKEGFEKRSLKALEAEVAMIPEMMVDVSEKDAEALTKLIAQLEEHEDVLNVYADFNPPEESTQEAAG